MTQNSGKVVLLVDQGSAMLESYGMPVRTYANRRSCLNNTPVNRHDCELVANSFPDMSGLDLLERLMQKGINVPLSSHTFCSVEEP
jgi:FixJ family two-component response regulator